MKYKVGDEVLVKCRINYVDNDVSLPYKVSRAGCISGFSKPLYILAGDDDIETMTAEEAWKLAIKLRYMDFEDKIKLFNLDTSSSREAWLEIMENMSPESVRDKIEAWEAEKNINIGDEVALKADPDNNEYKFFVTYVDKGLKTIGGFSSFDGDVFSRREIGRYQKTGRHIDIDGILKQIGGSDA